MAITAKVEGLAEISEMLTKLEEEGPKAAAAGLYDGAGVMAKEIEKGIDGIKTAPFKYTKVGVRLPSPEEVESIKSKVGIAKFSKNGTEIFTTVGLAHAGYTEVNGKKKAVALIANSISSGTSFMQKQPFVRKSATKGAKAAEAAIIKTIEQRLDEKNLK